VATGTFRNFLRLFQRRLASGEAGESTDRHLLQRFAQERDEAAFTALVQRHGPLVLGVCRRVLGPNDADDALQATFLVLARKAGSLSQPDRLSNWLYGVALRVAQKARAEVARRRARLQEVKDMPAAERGSQADWNELRQVLDEEVQRLPQKFRLPLLLCYLEGKTREEAARQLGWSAGAVKGMLERGRELLRSRLTRRGIALSATALAGLLSENALSAAVPAALSDSTVKAALLFAAGKAAAAGSAAALAEGVLQAMGKFRFIVMVVGIVALAAVGTGVGVLASSGPPTVAEPSKKADGPPLARDERAEHLRRAAARLEVAKGAYEGHWLAFQLGRGDEQTVNLWSRRWLQAQLDLTNKKVDREAALQAHLERLKKVDEVARERLDLGSTPEPSLKFDIDKPHYEDRALEHFETTWKECLERKASLEQVCNASVRVLVLQQWYRKLGKKSPQADPKDLEAHLDRIKKVEAVVKLRAEAGMMSGLELDTITFYRLEAEDWVAQKKAFPDAVLRPDTVPEK
jgi:RNA polymerase sigma factor (sigma-70 family)